MPTTFGGEPKNNQPKMN
ncbi:hypothetical protein [Staphylococcus aureus]